MHTPRRKNIYYCLFSNTHTYVLSIDVGTVKRVYVQPYHDGIRVSWDPHHYADNQGISYHLQVSPGNSEYVNIYRGGNTKFTWKTELESGVGYGFRVQVRTTEGVGNWSEPVEACQGAPGTDRRLKGLVSLHTHSTSFLLCLHYTPYSARMSPENTHKLMGIYMEVLILGIIH